MGKKWRNAKSFWWKSLQLKSKSIILILELPIIKKVRIKLKRKKKSLRKRPKRIRSKSHWKKSILLSTWSKEQRRNLPQPLLGFKFLVFFFNNLEIDSKDLTKKLSKKFACSCSAQDSGSAVIQGDFYDDAR